MWIECFKSGKQTDSLGREKEWTNDDLDKIVEKYNNQSDDDRHEAPVVIGHPQTDSPAYGWVESLKREGNILMAKLKQMNNDFVELVKQGAYKKRSISIYGDLMLKHIGFLGGVAPAVKGLADPAFKETDKADDSIITCETAESEFVTAPVSVPPNKKPAPTKANAKPDQPKDKPAKEKETMPGSIDEFITAVAAFAKEQYGEDIGSGILGFMNKNKGGLKTAAPAPKDNGKFSEPDPEREKMQKQIDELVKERDEAKFNEFFRNVASKGIVPPAQKGLAKYIYESLNVSKVKELSYSESEDLTPLQAFEKLINSFGELVKMDEFAIKGFAAERGEKADLDAQAKWLKDNIK